MQWLWPNIDDIEDAQAQCRTGASVAFIICLVTAVVTLLQTQGVIKWFEHIDAMAYIDAGLFFIIGVGLRYHSRLTALAGLGLYGFEQYAMIQMYGFRFNLLALFFIIAFMNAVRGSFAYHHFKREMKKNAAESLLPEGPISVLTGLPIPKSAPQGPLPEIQPAEVPSAAPKKFPFLSLIMAFLTLLIIGVAFTTFSSTGLREKIRKETSEDGPSPLKTEVQELITEKGPSPEEDPSVKTFKLKSGKIITGRVVVDDPVYVTVQVSAKKQEIILREDLAKE